MDDGPLHKQPWARPVSLADVAALVELVRESAVRGAREGLEALAATVPVPIAAIAIRACPQVPPTTEEQIVDYSRDERRRLTVTQILIALAYIVGFIFVVMGRSEMGGFSPTMRFQLTEE